MVAHGFDLPVGELSELELGYIGGLLRLDLRVDTDAQAEVFMGLGRKRAPSPDRKG